MPRSISRLAASDGVKRPPAARPTARARPCPIALPAAPLSAASPRSSGAYAAARPVSSATLPATREAPAPLRKGADLANLIAAGNAFANPISMPTPGKAKAATSAPKPPTLPAVSSLRNCLLAAMVF